MMTSTTAMKAIRYAHHHFLKWAAARWLKLRCAGGVMAVVSVAFGFVMDIITVESDSMSAGSNRPRMYTSECGFLETGIVENKSGLNEKMVSPVIASHKTRVTLL